MCILPFAGAILEDVIADEDHYRRPGIPVCRCDGGRALQRMLYVVRGAEACISGIIA